MKQLIVNLVAIMVIGVGGLSLAIPANAAPNSILGDITNMIRLPVQLQKKQNKCKALLGGSCSCSGGCSAGVFHCHCTNNN